MKSGRTLMWCSTHEEPGWLYDDGSKTCWWESIVETSTDDHEFITLPVVEAADELAKYCRLVEPEYGDVHAALRRYEQLRGSR